MAEAVIQTEGFTRRYGSTVAVDGLTLTVDRGQVFGFLGRNGAGKTTTIKTLLGLLRPTSGSVRVLGLDPVADGVELRQRIGYVSETPQLYPWMRVREMVRFTGSFYDRWNDGHIAGLLGQFGLDPERRVKNLSRGMGAQLALVLAMGHEPELLILDEPATGLDVLVRRDFLESIVQVIQQEGRTVMLSSHMVHEMERVADRVAVIEGGRLLACDDTDAFKGRVKKVLVRLSGGDEDGLRRVDGVSEIEGSGDRRLVTVADYGEAHREALGAAGADVVDVVDMSLEESFIEMVRPYARRQGEL
ncbi:MAG TPA: ABC transporter ATP-binding protein [Candidatus Latescibacteria bacterium]|jgi:ABC-2 type transport system ATP-binding protein|nr:ABC transporter [Gemmatimonadaceae bacterium]MDP6019345.1 ABC transporter ATP-binding protein [Candidatus Latescibacterota bacterium]HJP33590.1 ABC transporter ATP-binding protein [Candidatus Latescibacterota bacterium]|tara:strand:+ start:239 stop:1147 length:909 start_codon:yes stop_codon:yes gene_type:complete